MIYALRRILLTLPLLLAVSFLVFALMDVLPGDPAARRFDVHASPKEVARWRHEHGLDEPLPVRWVHYVEGIVTRFNFGESFTDDRPVGKTLLQKLEVTLELSFCALFLAILVGTAVGVLSAVFPGSWLDGLGNLLALSGISLPVFWLGMLLWIFTADVLHLPYRSGRPDVLGFSTDFYLLESLIRLRFDVFWDQLGRIALPAITLSTIPMAVITRMTRSSMLEELGKDYATTARAKGLTRKRVVWKHVFRNALIPITTITGLQFGTLLGGAVLTETVFSWPGLGDYIVTKGVRGNDTPIVVGGILLVASTFILVNLATDLLYGVIDPRVRRRT